MSNRERIRKALDSLLYLPHLQAQHNDSLPVAAAPPGGGGPAGAAAAGRGRPWDRGDLFRRLATFKSSTWFCKPTVISPVECARRGWTNTAADLLSCEFCKAKLSCPIPADLLPEEAAACGARYAASLADAHDSACPWRTATSSPSLLQFPPLTQEAVRRDFDARCSALQRLVCLPPVAGDAYTALQAASSKQRLDQLLLQGPPGSSSQQQQQTLAAATAAAGGAADAAASVGEGTVVLGSPAFEARARLLALCGWDVRLMATTLVSPRGGSSSSSQQEQQQEVEEEQQLLPAHVGPESAALLCSLCAAKAGLWTFFPQCKPLVLQAPRRRSTAAAGGAAGGGAPSPSSAVVHRASSISWNVAVDIGTTIAGGAMPAGGGEAAASSAPFGAAAAAQAPAFGGPPATRGQGAENGAPTGAAQQPTAAATAAPFGSGQGGGLPVFGFAAMHAPRPAAADAGGSSNSTAAAAAAAGSKRKEPDFSWGAVLADIDAKSAAAQKRGKAAEPAEGAAAADAAAASAAAAARRGPVPSRQQVLAAAAAAAHKYQAVQAAALDPLALHRPFCPWVNSGAQAGEKEGRCGWRWCLQQLAAPAPVAAAGEGGGSGGSADAAGGDGDGGGGGSAGGKEWDPAKLLRTVLQQVDVHK